MDMVDGLESNGRVKSKSMCVCVGGGHYFRHEETEGFGGDH